MGEPKRAEADAVAFASAGDEGFGVEHAILVVDDDAVPLDSAKKGRVGVCFSEGGVPFGEIKWSADN